MSNSFSNLSFSLLISCTVLLTACSGGLSSLSQGNSDKEEPTEVTLEALDESSFDYETLYADDFKVTNNFKYKEYPTLDIDKIDLDRVSDDLLAFIVADLGLEEDEESSSEETNNESSESEKDVAVVDQDDEAEEVANEESGNPEAAENESTELDEALDETINEEESFEKDDAWQAENGEVEEYLEDDGWVEGKGYPWHIFAGGHFDIVVDPVTKTSDAEIYNAPSDTFRYAPLTGESGLCPAEYCLPPSELPDTAFFGKDGYIYDTEYAGTWEYYIDDEEKWTWFAWNNF
ncbi:hypothetical protein ACI2JA_04140 [Alkalihalobacillus sp. NPDC078783]